VKHLPHFPRLSDGLAEVIGGLLTLLILAWIVLAIDRAAAHAPLFSLFR
jgi:hypothetical protein